MRRRTVPITYAKTHCADCGKVAPTHWWSDGVECCRCFLYLVRNSLWNEVAKLPAKMPEATKTNLLCLYCFRQRLDREIKIKDFDDWMIRFPGYNAPFQLARTKIYRLPSPKKYIRALVQYANSGENTSLVW